VREATDALGKRVYCVAVDDADEVCSAGVIEATLNSLWLR
jgi:hypothetical protein